MIRRGLVFLVEGGLRRMSSQKRKNILRRRSKARSREESLGGREVMVSMVSETSLHRSCRISAQRLWRDLGMLVVS